MRSLSMKRMIMMGLVGSFLMLGCAGTNDSYVDSEMGLAEENPKAGYDAAVDELKQQRYQEGTRRLQEMAADPNY